MKKLLLSLGAIGLVATTGLTVVSCGNKPQIFPWITIVPSQTSKSIQFDNFKFSFKNEDISNIKIDDSATITFDDLKLFGTGYDLKEDKVWSLEFTYQEKETIAYTIKIPKDLTNGTAFRLSFDDYKEFLNDFKNKFYQVIKSNLIQLNTYLTTNIVSNYSFKSYSKQLLHTHWSDVNCFGQIIDQQTGDYWG